MIQYKSKYLFSMLLELNGDGELQYHTQKQNKTNKQNKQTNKQTNEKTLIIQRSLS